MRRILTFFAVCCRCAAWFPLWLMLFSLNLSVPMLPGMAMLFGTAVCAVFWKRFCEKRFLRGRTAVLVEAASVLLLTAGCAFCLTCLHCGAVMGTFMTAMTLLFVMFKAEKPSDELYTEGQHVVFLTGNLVAALLLHLAHLPVPLTMILTVTAAVSACRLLLLNQFMLLRLVNRRSASETDVPKAIMHSNLKMVGGILLVILCLLFFRRPLLQMLIWMQDAARAAVSGCFTLLTRLIAWLDSHDGEALPQLEQDTAPKFQRGGFNPLWLVLWVPFIAVAVIVWKNFLSDWVELLRDLLIAFIQRLRGTKTRTAGGPLPEQADYFDTVTDERPPRNEKQTRREWRRKLREWMRLPDNSEKFYVGYVLLTEAPAWSDTKLCASDTVQEIRAKWADAHTPAEALDAVTKAYHADRYAEQGLPPEALAALTDTLRQLK